VVLHDGWNCGSRWPDRNLAVVLGGRRALVRGYGLQSEKKSVMEDLDKVRSSWGVQLAARDVVAS
jgi:hypothetical protein